MRRARLEMMLVCGGAAAMLTVGCDSANVTRPDAAAVLVSADAASEEANVVDTGPDSGPAAASGGKGGNLSSSGGTGSGDVAGAPATGGASSTGGGPATGGASGSSTGGAAPATGGSHAGGATGSGGAIGSGGMTVATGGVAPATGGRPSTGGTTGTGGRASTGGAPAAGGVVGTGGMATGGRSTGGSGPPQSASLYVVAHPDDELLFMNPDLETDIQSGRPVVTVYVTSGDGGNPATSAWRARETSGMAAHAAMAGVASNWLCGGATYAGKTTTRCILPGRDGLVILMLRVGEGTVPNTTFTGTLTTIDNTATYTRAELIATLAAIQTQVAPGRVGTMDGTLAHGSDQQDHVATAVLMFDAARADGVARALTMYRAYNMFEPSFATGMLPAPEPANLTTAQYQEKLRIISVYEPPPLDDSFDDWCHRLYPVRALTGAAAPVHTSAGTCLQASGSADGAAVTVATCNGAATQNWIVGANSRVTGTGGRCLAVATGGTAAVLRTCNNASPDQRWTLLSNGQLRGTALTCLTFSGSAVSAMPCGSDTSQPHYSPPASQRWAR